MGIVCCLNNPYSMLRKRVKIHDVKISMTSGRQNSNLCNAIRVSSRLNVKANPDFVGFFQMISSWCII